MRGWGNGGILPLGQQVCYGGAVAVSFAQYLLAGTHQVGSGIRQGGKIPLDAVAVLVNLAGVNFSHIAVTAFQLHAANAKHRNQHHHGQKPGRKRPLFGGGGQFAFHLAKHFQLRALISNVSCCSNCMGRPHLTGMQ